MTMDTISWWLALMNLSFASWNVSQGSYGAAMFNAGTFLMLLAGRH